MKNNGRISLKPELSYLRMNVSPLGDEIEVLGTNKPGCHYAQAETDIEYVDGIFQLTASNDNDNRCVRFHIVLQLHPFGLEALLLALR